nr:hypothetical protein [Leifsonia shinshuensis]
MQANRPTPRPYRGGAGIERFRAVIGAADPWAPEDFLGSTVTTFGSNDDGLTRIDGVPLRDLIAADPLGFLGAEHVERFGADTRLLCKLLHTGERLFVHAHPDSDFARRELGADTGKTEAWIVLAVDEPEGGRAWLGFADDVDADRLESWFEKQEPDELVAALNEIELHPGDTLFVPAGVPHAIGSGILLLELQQPADLSVILEYAPFERLTREAALLGLDARTALSSVARTRFTPADIAEALGRLPAGPYAALFPDAARAFFRAEAIAVTPESPIELPAQYAVLVATDGQGTLRTRGETITLTAGDVVLIPHGAGPVGLAGELRAIRCLPPDPRG